MCTLYAMSRSQDEVRRIFRVYIDETGNLPPLKAIFPDQVAPVVREVGGRRELVPMRWGFPPPPNAVGGRPVVNVRNVASSYWKPWLKSAQRCLVPVTSFSEYADTTPRKTPVWFALSDERPLFAFAGIWRNWNGVRGTKADPVEGEHLLFSFLTTRANGVVGPVHPKAMPVLLTGEDEWRTWLEAPTEVALELQRPLPDATMREVARGVRSDAA